MMTTAEINNTILCYEGNKLSARDRAAARRALQAVVLQGHALDDETKVRVAAGPLTKWWPIATAIKVAAAILDLPAR